MPGGSGAQTGISWDALELESPLGFSFRGSCVFRSLLLLRGWEDPGSEMGTLQLPPNTQCLAERVAVRTAREAPHEGV